MSDKPQRKHQLLSVVIPAFNEAAVIELCYVRVKEAVTALAPGLEHELIVVDDGSTDDTYERLRVLAGRDPALRLLRLSRNFGQQMAITAGLDHCRGDAVVILDADLQDPPELIPEFVKHWRAGCDVVYGRRTGRHGESLLKRATANAFYRFLRQFTSIDIPADAGDFRLISRRALQQLQGMRERDRYLRGLVSWVGFRQQGVDYERNARHAGHSKYPLRKMMKFALTGFTSFSTAPLRLASVLGYLTSTLAFLYLVHIFVQSMLGATVRGWPSIMAALLFLGGVQLICIGIVGEYIGRIFDEVKARPIYILAEGTNLDTADQPDVPSAELERRLS